MSDTINKSQIYNCLRELADYEFQKRTWLASTGPEVSSFPELISQLFDDTGLGDALENDFTGFDTQTNEALRDLGKAVSKVNQKLLPGKLLESREMGSVREMASRVLLCLCKQ